MFCTKCGAENYENERFCAKCGSALKHGGEAAPQPQYTSENGYDPYVISITPERAAELMLEQNSGQKKTKKQKKLGGIIMALAVVLLLLIFVGAISNCYDASTPQEFIDAFTGKQDEETNEVSFTDVNDSEFAFTENTTTTAAEVTTTAETTTTATTTTTTKATTTATQQDLLLVQAKEIRELLVAKKWKTTIEGYDAIITFNDDGTALIEVDIKIGFFSVHQKVNAEYEISPKCFAKVIGEYNGTKYGISGIISKKSDSELVVDRGGDRGTVTLKEVK